MTAGSSRARAVWSARSPATRSRHCARRRVLDPTRCSVAAADRRAFSANQRTQGSALPWNRRSPERLSRAIAMLIGAVARVVADPADEDPPQSTARPAILRPWGRRVGARSATSGESSAPRSRDVGEGDEVAGAMKSPASEVMMLCPVRQTASTTTDAARNERAPRSPRSNATSRPASRITDRSSGAASTRLRPCRGVRLLLPTPTTRASTSRCATSSTRLGTTHSTLPRASSPSTSPTSLLLLSPADLVPRDTACAAAGSA